MNYDKIKIPAQQWCLILVIDFLQHEIQTNHDLIATYRHHITATMNQSNVSQFLRSYNSRTNLEVERPVPGGNVNVRTLKLVEAVVHVAVAGSCMVVILNYF